MMTLLTFSRRMPEPGKLVMVNPHTALVLAPGRKLRPFASDAFAKADPLSMMFWPGGP